MELPTLPLRSILRPLLAIGIGVVALSAAVALVGRGVREKEKGPEPPRATAQAIDLRVGGLVELGGHPEGWEPQVVQCYFSDRDGATLPLGTVARFRGDFVGRSLGIAIQLDRCALDAGPQP